MAKYRYTVYSKTEAAILILIFAIFVSGYLLNFQNLWEYWPASSQFTDVSLKWITSFIGVFIPPFGMFTGWIF